ncbi:nitrilase family protein [Cyclobacterium marinum]|uniref:Nitrilase/cyanide hydratase and apolipoprotein N-acyltransferase n=1 Tax=Cyclobacterium marinum (strain ATCC 25205 / DSM 745 / LMG 13164 / NCIMB 1802) TaxID=880070 RepID=G0J561_CYCMS|nr:nitrilase family protein [Cyclobacterium marinum]AEL26745.1 Nitrilase/cyanide hydratase and apolipoprotein N-acyltransferase [Cyclobacterium marinum DSM 745]
MDLKIASAQFENRSGVKEYNLNIIEEMSKKAAEEGADIIAFHECSITGYSFARKLSKKQMLDLSEYIPDGPSIQRLTEIARKNKITLLAGLFEKDNDGGIFKSYVCVDENGLQANYHKLHPFINPHITPGSNYCVFECKGWKCGILICYDNNIIENVRATCLLGAEIIFMPHVTMCTPSTRPGAGFVDPKLWENRKNDPTSLRLEFDGMKGRQWLMKWLPARAYDNGVYVVFSNPIGMDDDQLKNGCSMIIDPYGDIIAECRKLNNEFVIADLTKEKLKLSGGYRYRNARRPELYGSILGKAHDATQKVAWLNK